MCSELREGMAIHSCFKESRNSACFLSYILLPLSITTMQMNNYAKGMDHRGQLSYQLSFHSVLELLPSCFWFLVTDPHTADFHCSAQGNVKLQGRQAVIGKLESLESTFLY